MWIAVVAIIIAILAIIASLKFRGKMMQPMDKGMVYGGIAGMLAGIALVEFYGFEYPVPFILWMLGMAGGQLIGWFMGKKK